MWSDIVKQNREHLMVLLKEWISEMEDLYDTVSSGDAGEIQNYFADAKEYRDSLPVRKRGQFLPITTYTSMFWIK